MSLQDAVRHLHHWCNLLPKTQYADLRPIFSLTYHTDNQHVRAKVLLPKSVDRAVREAQSSSWCKSEKLAKREAAFEAYIALYHAGLVNDHLLPLVAYDEAALKAYSNIEKRPSLVKAKERLSPWAAVATAWQTGSTRFQSTVKFSTGHSVVLLRMISPFALPSLRKLILYLDLESITHIDFDPVSSVEYGGETTVSETITRLLLSSVHQSRMRSDRSDFPILFEPLIDIAEREKWLAEVTGTRPADTLHSESPANLENGIIRDHSTYGAQYILRGVEYKPLGINQTQDAGNSEPEMELVPFLVVSKLTKRADFLHPIVEGGGSRKTTAITHLLPNTCTVDNLPFTYSQCAMYIPCIMNHVETALITEYLCNGLLLPVQFEDHHLVTMAITASSAREAYNYQSLELMGDSCLKVCATMNVMAEHPNWHEGYLSHQKDHIVSNGRLSLAAQQTGLDQYIIAKAFTGYKWKPLYNDDLLESQPARSRELSSKTLADVVEALLGAAFVDGGFAKVIACLSIFVSEISWRSLDECRKVLQETAIPNDSTSFPPYYSNLETLVGHQFKTKSLLLEALTHPSHLGPDVTPSYQRMEFMGDALLDIIITTRVFRHRLSLKPFRMHLLRTALVNANFLAFVVMRHSIPITRTNLPPKDLGSSALPSESVTTLSIWHFMRHSHSADLAAAQASCYARFVELEPAISKALVEGDSYPWTLLTTLAPDKFFSDIVESIIAAIYIDSVGSLAACEAFLTLLGILPYVDRALDNELHVMHPKEELGVAAGNDKVTYEVVAMGDGEEEGYEPGYKCKVMVGKQETAVVYGARTRIEAETRVAEEALRVLKQHLERAATHPRDEDLEQERPEHEDPAVDDDDEEDEYVDAVDFEDNMSQVGQEVRQDGGEDVVEDKDNDVRMGGCMVV